MLGRREPRVGGDQRLGARSRAHQQPLVLGQPRERELTDARLPGADQLALLAQPQVDLRQLEAVVVALQRRQPGRGLRPAQQAQRGVLAAPDAPAQLVQLRDPEALGVLDQHHGRVRHVDPDLDHRRRDEHVGLAGRERRHRRLLLAVAELPVQQHEAEVAQLPGPQPLELLGRRARLRRASTPSSTSPASISGQTTNAWRPARTSSAIRS